MPSLPCRIVLLALLMVLTTVPLGRSLQAQSGDSVTAAMARAIAANGLVGATWSLVTPAGVTVGAAGLKDRARNIPMRPDDRVQVGSVAKTLIATGMLRLVTQGRVELDAPVSRYLPDLPIPNPWATDAPLLVRHLLDHTSGLDDARMWQVFTSRGDPDAPLRSGLTRGGASVHIRYRPGARFSYSNSGFLLAAIVMEQVTRMRYETWLAGELLAPLGMTRSTFAFVTQVGPSADRTMAMGHFDGVTANPSYAIPVRPSSQFATTAADMARLARFLMSDGTVNGRPLVDSTLLRAMAVPVTTESVRAGLQPGYALGLVRRERWGITGKCHLGNIGTFRAILCLYPDHGRAFFASYNTDPEGANWDSVDSILATRLGVPATPAVPAAPPDMDAAAWNGWYAVRPNRFEQFAYLDEITGVARIAWDGSALTLRPVMGTARLLEPVGGRLFRLEGRRSATHVLTRSADGVPLVSDGQRTFERVSRTRVVLLWSSAIAGLLALFYLLVAGSVRTLRAWRRGTVRHEPLRWATLTVVPMVLAPLLYLTQPFLAIGDPTPANLVVATLTGAFPVALLLSLLQRTRERAPARHAALDLIALGAALQWCVVLALWGLLPLMLWR
jgi:CubicO group peptidase (beta-lactamase class C family)